jgi:hypothetical protein
LHIMISHVNYERPWEPSITKNHLPLMDLKEG